MKRKINDVSKCVLCKIPVIQRFWMIKNKFSHNTTTKTSKCETGRKGEGDEGREVVNG